MSRCNSCSAPLPANTNRCIYCGTRNDVDLHGKYPYSISQDESERICPHCDKSLQTIALNLHYAMFIERCDVCYGLFFDPEEIETLLIKLVPDVFDINLKHIRNINQDRYLSNRKVQYIQCPVCRSMMNRVNFGHRSGVIIDHCKEHGVWLDNGEITHLLEWRKAGGQMLHEKKSLQNRVEGKHPHKPVFSSSSPGENHKSQDNLNTVTNEEFIESVSSVFFKLFDQP